jgi:formate dehydrogenase subunit beta
VPALITDPEQVIETAGTLHCASPNIARCLKTYLDGALDIKVAVTGKPCDIRAIVELTKRKQIERENLVLVGLNCTGTLPPAAAQRMCWEAFGIDPNEVVREDIEDGRLTLTLRDGTEVSRELAELEREDYGRRENCQRCDVHIPTMADLACGKWGTRGGKVTCVEVCSQTGSDVLTEAIEARAIVVERPSSEALAARTQKEREAIDSARTWQERHFVEMRGMSIEARFAYWRGQFNQCIKCFACKDACPICYCTDCYLEADRGLIAAGQVPPDIMFPVLRTIHVADSCVNCGQCQDGCPSEIPLSKLVHMLNVEIGAVLGYRSGMDARAPPPLSIVPDEELDRLATETRLFAKRRG